MAYVIAIVAGFAGAALGWIAAGFAALGIMHVLGMPLTANALPDTFHLLNQLGAMAGFLLAIGLTLRLSGRARSMREGAQSSLVIAAALAVIFAAGSNLRLSAMEHLGLNAGARSIEFEIRLPPVDRHRLVQARSPGRTAHRRQSDDRAAAQRRVVGQRRRPRDPERHGADRVSHRTAHARAQHARPAAAPVQDPPRGQSEPLRRIQPVAPGRLRRQRQGRPRARAASTTILRSATA